MAFERHENVRVAPPHRGGAKIFATLYANTEGKDLAIGAYVRDAGFDTEKRYVLSFDRKTKRIKLEPDALYGFKVQRRFNHNATHLSILISAKSFCKRFGITDRLECFNFEIESKDVWILHMRKARTTNGK